MPPAGDPERPWEAAANEAEWSEFDAALRKVAPPEPDPSLRDRCLPGVAAPVSRCRVLVVDDEPNIRRLVRFHLEDAGHEVLTASDGWEAMELVRSRQPDLILLDVMMPGPDGFQVLEALKSEPDTAQIPVVMLTARATDDHIRKGWQTGNDWYVTKPFNPLELRALVNRFAEVKDLPGNPPPLRRWNK